jgi:2',3'-cyclic-nucleotide 2'-phosphodiesterase (5'-nucleotidase family)
LKRLAAAWLWYGALLYCLLFLAGCAGKQDVRSLTILHLNDLHAHLLPDAEGRGGFAYLASAIAAERANSERVLVLHAGDLVQGTPVSTLFEGQPIWEVAGGLGFDVNTLGNHEFDYGWKKIPGFLEAVDFPTVTANVVDPGGGLLTTQGYVIRDVNGIRVAVIGLMTATLDRLTRSEAREPWKALPAAEVAERVAQQVQGEADLIVALAHIDEREEEAVLRDAPSVDVLISGHSHGGQEQAKEYDGRICVKVRAYGVELGRLDLEVDVPGGRVVSHGWRRLPVTTDRYAPEPAVAGLVDTWERKVADLVDIPIGEARRNLDRSELRPWIEAVMLDAVGADIAYMNPGGIRSPLRKGRILIRDVWNIEPFSNRILYGRATGKQIPEEARGSSRIDPEGVYILATNDFIADKWREEGRLTLDQEGPLIRDAVIEWIRRRKVIE